MNLLKLFSVACSILLPLQASAQQWDLPVRGSWLANEGEEALVLVDGDILVQLVVPGNARSGVRKAAEFLAKDIYTITGQLPPIVENSQPGRVSIFFHTLGEGNSPPSWNVDDLAGKWEAHQIRSTGDALWLVGSNSRGTAFAAYTLSERLGIDPLYHWTGYSPERRESLAVRKIEYESDEPTFKYRGLFHDDEDTLPTPDDKNGYPQYAGGVVEPIWYERYFETALRLRMNQVAPFVRVVRPFEIQKKASDWGLFYSSHHYDILLSNPFGYDRFGLADEREISGDYDWSSNQDGILQYWHGGLEENKNLDAIWPVGLRGTADTAYQFPEGTTQEEKNKVFTDAIQDQVDLTKSVVSSDKSPVFHFTLYGEMLRNYQSGSFEFPEDVILVWNDDGDALMRALPETLGKWKHGIYYHLAYYGSTTKQTHHTVRPDRIEEQFRNIVESGATEYLLTNVSEMREYVMNTRFIADVSWDAEAAFAEPNAAGRFVDWWSREYFGEQAASQASKSYAAYFDILHSHDQLMQGAMNVDRTLDRLEFRLKGDHHMHYMDEDRVNLIDLEARIARYERAFESARLASEAMDAEQARFFFENLELGLMMDYYPTKAASLLNQALRQYPDETALMFANEALSTLEELESAIKRAERPPFDKWYKDTWIRRVDSWTNPHYSYYRVKEYLENYESRYK